MRFFLKKIFGFLFTSLLLFVGLIILFNHNSLIQEELNRDYLQGYINTLNRIKVYPNSKIIFVGGSNLGFGLNSKEIEDKIGIKTFNFGVHGGIGIKKPIEDLRPFLKEGDVVIVSPEYSNFDLENYGDAKFYLSFLDGIDISDFHSYDYFLRTFPFVGYTVKSVLLKNVLPKNDDSYNSSWFNSNGDVVEHHRRKTKKIINFSEERELPDDRRKLNELKGFLDKTIEGAEYFFIPPVTFEGRFSKDEERLLNDILSESFGDRFPLLINELTFKKEYFFDTTYHLNLEGKVLRTQILLGFLEELFQKN